jgi:hypothetical protein
MSVFSNCGLDSGVPRSFNKTNESTKMHHPGAHDTQRCTPPPPGNTHTHTHAVTGPLPLPSSGTHLDCASNDVSCPIQVPCSDARVGVLPPVQTLRGQWAGQDTRSSAHDMWWCTPTQMREAGTHDCTQQCLHFHPGRKLQEAHETTNATGAQPSGHSAHSPLWGTLEGTTHMCDTGCRAPTPTAAALSTHPRHRSWSAHAARTPARDVTWAHPWAPQSPLLLQQ